MFPYKLFILVFIVAILMDNGVYCWWDWLKGVMGGDPKDVLTDYVLNATIGNVSDSLRGSAKKFVSSLLGGGESHKGSGSSDGNSGLLGPLWSYFGEK
uniref:Uncharacterized protein n=1 Tax=Trichobilharzia regenti TaxID=157069 RepID=A0AA85KLH8_TRIRE|nr:unnamed protein product [Trichobilharzia regenti]